MVGINLYFPQLLGSHLDVFNYFLLLNLPDFYFCRDCEKSSGKRVLVEELG